MWTEKRLLETARLHDVFLFRRYSDFGHRHHSTLNITAFAHYFVGARRAALPASGQSHLDSGTLSLSVFA